MFFNLTKTFNKLSNTFILTNLLIIFWQSFDNLLIVPLLKTKTHETTVIPITAKQTTTADTITPKTTGTILSKIYMKKQPACKTFFDELQVSFRIQSECGKIWTRKKSVIGHFLRSVYTHTYTVI